MALFGEQRRKLLEEKMKAAGIDPTTGKPAATPLRAQQTTKPVNMKPKPTKKVCPVWVRDEDCASGGYLPRK